MMFLDSWIWIEFFSQDPNWKEAQEVLQQLEQKDGIISALVLSEVRYRFLQKTEKEKADRIIQAIESFERLQVLPVTGSVAKYGADLRKKYYQRGKVEMSYADAIHLATAVLTKCDVFYTGDSDFHNVDEIQTKVI